MKYLIVTADDFGLSKSINEGIIKAFKEGIVTSINVLPSGGAFEDASGLLKDIGLKEIGAHLSLTEIPPLTKKVKFYKTHTGFFIDLFLKKIDPDDIYAELKNQLDRLRALGLKITNLSSHEHIHMMPAILDIFVRLAKEYDISAIRYPAEGRPIPPLTIKKIYKRSALSYYINDMSKVLKEAGIIHTDNFFGFLDSGNLTESLLVNILNSLREGTTELVSHPGFLSPEVLDNYKFHINCESELFTLTSKLVKKAIEGNNIKLITYGEFISKK